jgi:putative FmdB family regulatory protein
MTLGVAVLPHGGKRLGDSVHAAAGLRAVTLTWGERGRTCPMVSRSLLMPTYEYACSSCHHEWETEQSIKDNALTECPTCHQQTARRQISRGGGFILKGGGWYSDLYSSASNKPSSGSSDASSSSSEGGSESKSSTDKAPDKAPDKTPDKSAKTEGGSTGTSGSSPAAASSSAPAV